MTEPSFDRRSDTPGLRSAMQSDGGESAWPCPFCSAQTLLLSVGDIGADRDRVEVYCDNTDCDAREIVVLLMRGEGAHDRADVIALQAVDEGTRAEQEARGFEFKEDDAGNVVARSASLGAIARDDDESRIVEYRTRPTKVTIDPL